MASSRPIRSTDSDSSGDGDDHDVAGVLHAVDVRRVVVGSPEVCSLEDGRRLEVCFLEDVCLAVCSPEV